jgi:hypothetical protein
LSDDFQTTLNRFCAAYDDLFALVAVYPGALVEKPGACGWWSPKQVLAHLAGWVQEANRRYAAFETGDTTDVSYRDRLDDFNTQSVAARATYTWAETVAQLQAGVGQLAIRASRLIAEQTHDRRYAEWLVGLREDCVEHTVQLRAFLA